MSFESTRECPFCRNAARTQGHKAGPPSSRVPALQGSLGRNGGEIAAAAESHIRIIRTAAAFGRDPGDILVRVLDVAGFAVDAVLPVDHVTGLARILDPFIDAG